MLIFILIIREKGFTWAIRLQTIGFDSLLYFYAFETQDIVQ